MRGAVGVRRQGDAVARSRRVAGLGPAVAIVLALSACAQTPSGSATSAPAPAPVSASPTLPSTGSAAPVSTETPPTTATPSPIADAVLLAAGDIAACSKDGDAATAAILKRYPEARVQTLGDNAYDKGTPRQNSAVSTTRGVSPSIACNRPSGVTTT
jgi:hypothetical protein